MNMSEMTRSRSTKVTIYCPVRAMASRKWSVILRKSIFQSSKWFLFIIWLYLRDKVSFIARRPADHMDSVSWVHTYNACLSPFDKTASYVMLVTYHNFSLYFLTFLSLTFLVGQKTVSYENAWALTPLPLCALFVSESIHWKRTILWLWIFFGLRIPSPNSQ